MTCYQDFPKSVWPWISSTPTARFVAGAIAAHRHLCGGHEQSVLEVADLMGGEIRAGRGLVSIIDNTFPVPSTFADSRSGLTFDPQCHQYLNGHANRCGRGSGERS